MRRAPHQQTDTRPGPLARAGSRRLLLEERGTAMVETALSLPLLLLLVFGIFEFGVTFRHYLTITDAARVGARAAAVARTTGECAAATTAIQNAVSASDWSVIGPALECTPGPDTGDPVTITLHWPYSIDVVGLALHTGTLTAHATERVE